MTGGGRRCSPTQSAGCDRQDNQTFDFELYSPSRFGGLGRPIYDPKYWDKVQELDMWTNKYDPVMTCQPLGVPREGPPRRIMQTDNDVVFFYQGGDAGGGYGEYRVIPTDNRQHDPKKAIEATYLGYAVGRWEGDTLVVDSISFVDSTWLGRGGLFHDENMHVIEKFRREGDVIYYDVTGGRSRCAGGAVGVADTSRAAQRKSQRGTPRGAWQLRSVRNQEHLFADPPLAVSRYTTNQQKLTYLVRHRLNAIP